MEVVYTMAIHPRQKLAGRDRSSILKRSIVVAGHRTSVTLEDAFWTGLKQIARSRGMTLSDIVSYLNARRGRGNLSSAIRLYVLASIQAQAHAGRPVKST